MVRDKDGKTADVSPTEVDGFKVAGWSVAPPPPPPKKKKAAAAVKADGSNR